MSPRADADQMATRSALHAVSAHVLGRRRHEVTGRFGLRATPGGIGTPAFGDPLEVVRVSGTILVRELGGDSTTLAIPGRSLRQLAAFAGTDIDRPFSVGEATPPLGDPDKPIELDGAAVRVLADWYALGWVVMDRFLAGLPDDAAPAAIQLWPEHFDAATNVGVPGGARLNVGFSPGDDFQPEPYAYVGPWGPERPGDSDFWNAPFGAVLVASKVVSHHDPGRLVLDFLVTGLRALSGGDSGRVGSRH
jgi:hypothetical protein